MKSQKAYEKLWTMQYDESIALDYGLRGGYSFKEKEYMPQSICYLIPSGTRSVIPDGSIDVVQVLDSLGQVIDMIELRS